MYERFTDAARQVMQEANAAAQQWNHEYIGTEHLLLGLIEESSGAAIKVLKNLGVDTKVVRLDVERLIQRGPDRVTVDRYPQTPRAKTVITYAITEARDLGHVHLGTEHILLGLIREREGVAAQVLIRLGVTLEKARQEVVNLSGLQRSERLPPAEPPSGDATIRRRRYERFTDRARKVVEMARGQAQAFNHEYIGTEHLLLALLKEGTGVAAVALRVFDVDFDRALREVKKLVPPGPDLPTMGALPQTPRAQRVIDYAVEESQKLDHDYVGTQHLLLGLLREQEGVAAQVLINLGVTAEDLRQEVLNVPLRPFGSEPLEFQVVITDFIRDDLGPERKILGDVAEVTALSVHDEKDLAGRIEEAHAIIVYHETTLTRQTIERLKRCKLIVRAGVGVDNIDREFARQRGIPVANVPDYGSEEVADTAIGMTLALTRGTHLMNSRLRAGDGPWSYEQVVPLRRLRGRTFGVVGLGRIGTAAALRAKALGMEVVFYDPYKPDGYDKALGIRCVETLDELLERSLVVSVHCPLTDETRHMIDAEAIGKMPRGSYLINTARGAVVDTRALPEVLASGQLAGVGLDVLEAEPPPADHPLVVAWRDPNHPAHHRLILNPHAAFYSVEGLLDMRTKTAEACRRAITGQPLRNVVN